MVVFRASTACGIVSRIRFDLLLHQFIFEAWEKKKINLFGANSWRPMVHVDDIARAIVLTLTKNDKIKSKDVFNVGSNDQNFKKMFAYDEKEIPVPSIKNIVINFKKI